MAILAGRAARFGAFAVLASAALLLSVAVPEAIAMEDEPLIRTDERESGGFGDMSEGTRPVVEPSASVPTGFVPQQSRFKGFSYLFGRGKRTQDEGTATSPSEFDELDGQKKGFFNFLRRGKKRGADKEADQETEPKKRFWSRLNPRNWFGNKEPELTGVELTGKCRLRPMTAEDKLGIELPTPQYIVGNIQNGIKQGKLEKKHLPSRFRPKARKLARNRQVCKPGTVLEELQGLIEQGIPGLSQNEDVRNAIGTLLEAVQRRTINWFPCFKVKVEHRKAECRREDETYTELLAKLPLCSKDVWNICQNLQAALEASPLLPVEPFPAGASGKGSDLLGNDEDEG